MKKIINRLEEAILLLTFPAMTIVTILGTAVRYFQLGSLTWSEEAARYLMIVSAFAGISLGFRENAHLGLSFVMDKLPKKIKPFFGFIRFIFLFIFTGLMIGLSYKLVLNQSRVSQLSPAMHIPMWIVYIPLLLGFCLMLFRIIQAFFLHKEEKQEVL